MPAASIEGDAAPALAGPDFALILKSPMRSRGRHFSLFWRGSKVSRLGTVVSRKLAGSAVRRNLVKRHARAMFQQWCVRQGTPGCVDVVLRVTADIRGLSRAAEFSELSSLFSTFAPPRAES